MYYILKDFLREITFEMASIFIYSYETDCQILCMNVANTVDKKYHSGMTHTDFWMIEWPCTLYK